MSWPPPHSWGLTVGLGWGEAEKHQSNTNNYHEGNVQDPIREDKGDLV